MKTRLAVCFVALLVIGCSDEKSSLIIYLDDWGSSDKVIQLVSPGGDQPEIARLYLISKDEDNTNLWNSKNLSVGDTTMIKYVVSDFQKQDANPKWPNISKHFILLR